jgi:plasmid stabilization system protein ParE
MSRRLRFSASAQADLNAIAQHIAEQSGDRSTGATFTRKVRARCDKLASLPGILGTARPELGADIRSTPFRGHVIFFRYDGRTFEVINVLDGHRDIDAHFDAEPS